MASTSVPHLPQELHARARQLSLALTATPNAATQLLSGDARKTDAHLAADWECVLQCVHQKAPVSTGTCPAPPILSQEFRSQAEEVISRALEVACQQELHNLHQDTVWLHTSVHRLKEERQKHRQAKLSQMPPSNGPACPPAQEDKDEQQHHEHQQQQQQQQHHEHHHHHHHQHQHQQQQQQHNLQQQEEQEQHHQEQDPMSIRMQDGTRGPSPVLDVLGDPCITALVTMLHWHTTPQGMQGILQALDLARCGHALGCCLDDHTRGQADDCFGTLSEGDNAALSAFWLYRELHREEQEQKVEEHRRRLGVPLAWSSSSTQTMQPGAGGL
ncbi:hypothetical protein DUNSADRAFT_9560 [Dunaliella salina]|uniref:Uncharacterized protein n=1 Tax=Dunaliella salina TaxID=3046 RepID=A0ABQ7GH70_DUNSA|nr:hypothetical protein DUNSADRAFT_9560 [Dunaliella salina]|eukprot:KAF5833948.1 hypothetical protein DUNSADRAFT_9560 [Dunaliella salina]